MKTRIALLGVAIVLSISVGEAFAWDCTKLSSLAVWPTSSHNPYPTTGNLNAYHPYITTKTKCSWIEGMALGDTATNHAVTYSCQITATLTMDTAKTPKGCSGTLTYTEGPIGAGSTAQCASSFSDTPSPTSVDISSLDSNCAIKSSNCPALKSAYNTAAAKAKAADANATSTQSNATSLAQKAATLKQAATTSAQKAAAAKAQTAANLANKKANKAAKAASSADGAATKAQAALTAGNCGP